MTQQAESYLILKPIAERFNRVAAEITDDDIEYIIKQLLKEKIANLLDLSSINDLIQEWIDNNEDMIIRAFKESLAERWGLERSYRWI